MTVYISDIFKVLISNELISGYVSLMPRHHRAPWHLFLISSGAFLIIGAYYVIWVPYVKKETVQYDAKEMYMSTSIMIASGCCVTASIAFMITLWPVYKILSIPMTIIFIFGGINLISIKDIVKMMIAGLPKPDNNMQQ